MIDIIRNALDVCGVSEYRINDISIETSELFFVRKKLDLRRINESRTWSVTVYREFQHEEQRCKGYTSVTVHYGMTGDEVEKMIRDAYSSALYVRNPFFDLVSGEKRDHISDEGDLSQKTLQQSAGIMAEGLFRCDNAEDAFVNSAEIFVERKDERIITSAGTDVSYTAYRTNGEFVVQCVMPEDVEMYHSFSYDNLAADELAGKVSEAITTVRDRAAAKENPKGGQYTVLLSGAYTGQIMSFYAERANAAYVYPGYSDYRVGTSVQGENVVGELVNITGCAVEPYSNEGIPMKDRQIVVDGVVSLIPGSIRFCRYLDVEPTGDYEKISSTNGTLGFEDMKKSERCLYVVSMSDFQVDELSGRFGGEIRLAYLYEGGQTRLLTGGSINGSLLECHSDLAFSTERYSSASYDGPFAVRLKGVNVAGSDE